MRHSGSTKTLNTRPTDIHTLIQTLDQDHCTPDNKTEGQNKAKSL